MMQIIIMCYPKYLLSPAIISCVSRYWCRKVTTLQFVDSISDIQKYIFARSDVM